MKKFFSLLLLFIFIGCSDDDSSNTDSQVVDGGEIFTSQLVVIQSDNLSQDEYSAVLDGQPISLARTSLNELVFLVPSNAEIGTNRLEIAELDNLIIDYDVKLTELNLGPDETLNELRENVDLFISSLEGDDQNAMQSAIDSFNSYYNSISEDDKNATAVSYYANKELVNSIFLNNDIGRTSFNSRLNQMRSNSEAKIILVKLLGSISAMGAGAVLVTKGDAKAKPIGAVAMLAGGILTYRYFNEFKDLDIKLIDLFIDNSAASISFERNSNQNNIEFISGVEKSLSFNSNNRSLISNDIVNGTQDVKSYIITVGLINGLIVNANQSIAELNESSFFSFDDFSELTINESPDTLSLQADEEIFSAFGFMIEDDNVELTSVSFDDGNLNLKVDIINPNQVINGVIDTQLKFNFTDDFNSFEGYFDIRVSIEDDSSIDANNLLAQWYLVGETENGVNIFDVNACNITIEFTSTQLIATEFFGDECESSDEITSSYEVNGNVITETADGDTSIITILELTPFKMVLQEVDGEFTYVETYANIFGDWTLEEFTDCLSTDGTTFTDNGVAPLILHSDYTVTAENDSNGNYITNNFTFENLTLTINLSYQDFFSPACNGVNYQTVVDNYSYTFNTTTNSFSGSGNSSANEVSGDGCTRTGRTCNSTVTLTR